MKGWDKPDPTDGSDRLKDQGVRDVAADQAGRMSLEGNIENMYLSPLSPDFNVPSLVPEFDMPSG